MENPNEESGLHGKYTFGKAPKTALSRVVTRDWLVTCLGAISWELVDLYAKQLKNCCTDAAL